ncbi:Y-family DNA polymerase [Acetobacter fabarum]|uniref:Y-family DNA polymerase n=1 Tax=Acetobacter fabarum TaxID=483199 RepID=UPI0039E8E0CA
MLYGLIDCNSFYCSCQRAFDPELKHRPVVVLSNNDGCAIARTAEAKQLGIKMGEAWHLVRNERKLSDVRWFSSNYPLYADMSRRVYQVLLDYSPRVEPYSIDEMFLDLSGFSNALHAHCGAMRQAVQQITKVPTCVGWGPTKTIAKLANGLAKDRPELEGLCDLTDPQTRQRFYRNVSVGEVWGVGRRLLPKLHYAGIRTIEQFVEAKPAQIRKIMAITGLRLQAELQGESCLQIAEMAEARKGMACTRSFGRPITTYDEMHEAITGFATRAAEKLRAEDLDAAHIAVFIQTNRHKRDDGWYANQFSISCEPTNDTFTICRHASRLLKQIWLKGYRYAKAGVMLNDLAPHGQQGTLFSMTRTEPTHENLLAAMDGINQKFGSGTLFPLSAGIKRDWRPRQAMLSARYTTRLEEIMEAQTW